MCLFPEKFGGLPSHSICDWHIDCEGCRYHQERDSEKRAEETVSDQSESTNQLRNSNMEGEIILDSIIFYTRIISIVVFCAALVALIIEEF